MIHKGRRDTEEIRPLAWGCPIPVLSGELCIAAGVHLIGCGGLGKGRSSLARSAGKLPSYEYNKINYRRVSRQRPPVPGVLHSLVTKYTIVVRVIERHGCMGSAWLSTHRMEGIRPSARGVTNLCYWRVTLDCNAQCQYRYICEGTTLGSLAG